MPMFHKIEENSIFVADAHYNEKRPEFLEFLQKLKDGEIKTKQLFLMGDMIDFISCESHYFVKRNKEVLYLINELSKNIEIFYFEGNHDYNMQKLFSKVKVFPREIQPVYFEYEGKKVGISHGDIFTNDKFYNIYCKFIRNPIFLKFMNLIDFGNFISKKIYYGLLGKSICRKMNNFEKIIENRIENYDCDLVVEGHFHQGDEFIFVNKRYKNIPSLTCSKEYCHLIDNKFESFKL